MNASPSSFTLPFAASSDALTSIDSQPLGTFSAEVLAPKLAMGAAAASTPSVCTPPTRLFQVTLPWLHGASMSCTDMPLPGLSTYTRRVAPVIVSPGWIWPGIVPNNWSKRIRPWLGLTPGLPSSPSTLTKTSAP